MSDMLDEIGSIYYTIPTSILIILLIIIIGYFVVWIAKTLWKSMRSSDASGIVLFSRKDCPYCIEFQPEWDKLTKSSMGISYKKVEPGNDPENLFERENVTGVPSIYFNINGTYTKYMGKRYADDILQAYQTHLESKNYRTRTSTSYGYYNRQPSIITINNTDDKKLEKKIKKLKKKIKKNKKK